MRILLLGDLALGSRSHSTLDCGDALVVANIEGPIISDLSVLPTIRGPYSSTSALVTFLEGRLLAGSLANNHSTDIGDIGLGDTCARMESLGARPLGTRLPSRAPDQVIAVGGIRIAFLARAQATTFGGPSRARDAGASVSILDENALVESVKHFRCLADRVVVLLHWGEEWVRLPRPQDRALGIALVRAGADLVIGHHAHVMQAWEMYHSRLIAYGLGTVDLRFPAYVSGDKTLPRDGTPRPWWAKSCLGVDWDPHSNQARMVHLTWHRDKLELSAAPKRPRRDVAYFSAPSQSRFAKAARFDFFTARLRSAIAAGVIPKPSHLASLWRLYRTAGRIGRGTDASS